MTLQILISILLPVLRDLLDHAIDANQPSAPALTQHRDSLDVLAKQISETAEGATK